MTKEISIQLSSHEMPVFRMIRNILDRGYSHLLVFPILNSQDSWPLDELGERMDEKRVKHLLYMAMAHSTYWENGVDPTLDYQKNKARIVTEIEMIKDMAVETGDLKTALGALKEQAELLGLKQTGPSGRGRRSSMGPLGGKPKEPPTKLETEALVDRTKDYLPDDLKKLIESSSDQAPESQQEDSSGEGQSQDS